MKKCNLDMHFNDQATTSDTSDKYYKLSAKLTPGQSNPGETKTMEATTPELGPVGFWSPKSSSFSDSDSIVVEATPL